ncbi:MAG: alpha/beta hydrolase-fold protein [Lacunisphaera sp.]|nr:alpha/beta hydrolase-fold protein [Lacunisphaera sp.]
MSSARKWWSWRPGDRTVVEQTEPLEVREVTPRRVSVYLPPHYDANRARPYPLLLALDGQTMPQWRLAETLDELVGAQQIEPLVVAAVPASPERIDEYGTAGMLDYAGRGRRAKAFQELLAGMVLPTVRELYHVADTPAHTGIFGASMGGLCAFDSAWRRPQVFGTAGIFSGSLWWRADDVGPDSQQTSRIAHRSVREAAGRPALRLWFQAGTRDEAEDRDGNGVIDAIQDTTELMGELAAKGFRSGADMTYHQIEGGEHHESTWAKALPEFLRWALPPRGR